MKSIASKPSITNTTRVVRVVRTPTLRHTSLKNGVGLLALLALGCSTPTVTSAHATLKASTTEMPDVPMNALHTLGETGEDAYDLAKAKNFQALADRAATLQRASRDRHQTWHALSLNAKHLTQSISQLRTAANARSRPEAMRAANRVTLFTAKLAAHLTRPRVPIDVTFLDVFGRDLEVGAALNDRVYLARAVRDLSRTWNRVRPALLARRGGRKVAVRFGALVSRVNAQTSPKQLQRLATLVLDEVDNLERVFER